MLHSCHKQVRGETERRHSNGQPKEELQWFSLTEVYSGWAWGSCQELVGCMEFQA